MVLPYVDEPKLALDCDDVKPRLPPFGLLFRLEKRPIIVLDRLTLTGVEKWIGPSSYSFLYDCCNNIYGARRQAADWLVMLAV